MTPDMVAELLRQLMKEAMILAAPLLVAAAALSFVLSLLQTLTSSQRSGEVCHSSAQMAGLCAQLAAQHQEVRPRFGRML